MWTVQGKSVFGGIAIGTLALYRKRENFIKRRHAEDTQAEVQRFEAARQEAVAQLAGLYEKAKQEVGESGAAIFDIHQMMLEDPDYVESVTNIIRTQEVERKNISGHDGGQFRAHVRRYGRRIYAGPCRGRQGHFRPGGGHFVRRGQRRRTGAPPIHHRGGGSRAQRDGAAGQVAGAGICDAAGQRQFPHRDFGAHDEHTCRHSCRGDYQPGV